MTLPHLPVVETKLRRHPLTADLVFSARQETDVRTGITKALAEYTSLVYGEAPGNRQLVLEQVFQTWADFENSSYYPSAVVLVPEDMQYGEARFTPAVHPALIPFPDGRYLLVSGEIEFDAEMQLWCTDTEERQLLCAALEAHYNPVDWMYGFILETPFYFGSSARFELKQMRYEDSDEEDMKRYRRAVFTLGCTASVLRLQSFPNALPAASIAVGVEPL